MNLTGDTREDIHDDIARWNTERKKDRKAKAKVSASIHLHDVYCIDQHIQLDGSGVLTAERAQAYEEKFVRAKTVHRSRIDSWLEVLGLPPQSIPARANASKVDNSDMVGGDLPVIEVVEHPA